MRLPQALARLHGRLQPRLRPQLRQPARATASWASAPSRGRRSWRSRRRSVRRADRGLDGAPVRAQGRDRGARRPRRARPRDARVPEAALPARRGAFGRGAAALRSRRSGLPEPLSRALPGVAVSLGQSAEASRIRALRPAQGSPSTRGARSASSSRRNAGPDGEVEPVAHRLPGRQRVPVHLRRSATSGATRSTQPDAAGRPALPVARWPSPTRACGAASPRRIKLYNASNFFEPRAVPPDGPAGARGPARGRSPESPWMPSAARRRRVLRVRARIRGRLEVAMGLETIHPEALPHLNKRRASTTSTERRRACGRHDIGVRAFVLVGAPFVPAERERRLGRALGGLGPRAGRRRWSRSSRCAAATASSSAWPRPASSRRRPCATSRPPWKARWRLGRGVVVADLWDAERLPGCPACRAARVERLARMNAQRADRGAGRLRRLRGRGAAASRNRSARRSPSSDRGSRARCWRGCSRPRASPSS